MNTGRVLDAPWLQVKNDLPEDGEAELFNKIGESLDVSHVQMTRFMQAANTAMPDAAETKFCTVSPSICVR